MAQHKVMSNHLGYVMNEVMKWKDVKCPYCHNNSMIPFFGYDGYTKELVTVCCKKVFNPKDLEEKQCQSK